MGHPKPEKLTVLTQIMKQESLSNHYKPSKFQSKSQNYINPSNHMNCGKVNTNYRCCKDKTS